MITKSYTIKTEDIESLLVVRNKIDSTILELQDMKTEINRILKNREKLRSDNSGPSEAQ
jgi:translation elongation factor EF-G